MNAKGVCKVGAKSFYGWYFFWCGLLTIMVILASPTLAQESTAVIRKIDKPEIFDMNLSTMPSAAAVEPWQEGDPVRVIEDLKESAGPTVAVSETSVARAAPKAAAMPATGVSFDGIPATGVLPPDTVGDVGPKHYIQTVNSAFSIYDKQGNLLAGPLPIRWPADGFSMIFLPSIRRPTIRFSRIIPRLASGPMRIIWAPSEAFPVAVWMYGLLSATKCWSALLPPQSNLPCPHPRSF